MKIVKRITFITFLGLLLPFCTYAQELLTQAALQVVPVSPNAASLGVYGAIPVSHYTGTPNISFPLYSLNLDGKEFPITLSYHASGVKVAQEASSVGMGWTLNGYGCITKDVKGWDDFESFPKGYYFDENMPAWIAGNDNDINQNNSGDFLKYHHNQKDGDPDLFHFNFGSYSGTMFFNKMNTGSNTSTTAIPLIQKCTDNLYIEYNISQKTWKAIDGDGYSYYFNTRETTEYFHTSRTTNYHPKVFKKNNDVHFDARTPQPETVTAWYLDSIVSPKNNKIVFEYEKDYIYTLTQMSESVYHLIESTSTSEVTQYQGNYNYSFSKIDQARLKKITTDLQTLEFTSEDRKDIEPVDSSKKAKRISQITQKDAQGVSGKKTTFSYKYLGNENLYEECRLFLTKISETAGNETIAHEFTYHESPALPDKYSNEIDNWGYYNGKKASGNDWSTILNVNQERTTYIPSMKINDYTYTSPFGRKVVERTYRGRSQETSHKHMKSGTLHKIKYPTGLVTRFEFEPHTGRNGDTNTIEKETKVLAKVGCRNFTYEDEENSSPEILRSSFSLAAKGMVEVVIYLNPVRINNENEFYFNNYVAILNSENKVIKEFSMNYYEMPQLQNLTKRFDLELNAGSYTLVLRKAVIETSFQYTTSISVWQNVNKINTILGEGGGLRIKAIYNEENGESLLNTRYVYELEDGKSSGLYMEVPKFNFIFLTTQKALYAGYGIGGAYAEGILASAVYAVGQTMPYTPFSYSAMSSPVGYNRVLESMPGTEDYDTERGIIYTYYNQPDGIRNGTEMLIPGFPGKPDYRNGLLLTKTYQNEGKISLKKTEYTYEQAYKDSIKGVRMYSPPIILKRAEYDHFIIYTKFYDVKAEGWRLKEEKTTSTYRDSDDRYIYNQVTTTSYKYPQKNHLPSEISTTNSDGSIHKTLYKYATDLTDTNSKKMVEKKMINPKLHAILLNGAEVIGGEKVEYTEINGMLLPKTYYRLNLTASATASNYTNYFEKVYTIDQYNSRGRILQATDESGVPTTYIWGYKNQFPIAMIQNMSYSTLSSQINVSSLENSFSPNISMFNTFRSNKNYKVNTFTYNLLHGVTKEYSPTGSVTTYTYDGFGRLLNIKDHNGYVIKQYEYNFKN